MTATVEPATSGDLEGVASIYNHYVLTSAHTFDLDPMPMSWWREWFSAFSGSGRYRLLVARNGDEVDGYAFSARYRDRDAYNPSVSTSVYVAPGRVGRGIGTALYRELVRVLEEEDVHRACAAVALPNASSVRLHERFGFRQIGVFTEQGRKFGKYWDVAWFERPF